MYKCSFIKTFPKEFYLLKTTRIFLIHSRSYLLYYLPENCRYLQLESNSILSLFSYTFDECWVIDNCYTNTVIPSLYGIPKNANCDVIFWKIRYMHKKTKYNIRFLRTNIFEYTNRLILTLKCKFHVCTYKNYFVNVSSESSKFSFEKALQHIFTNLKFNNNKKNIYYYILLNKTRLTLNGTHILVKSVKKHFIFAVV